MSSETVKKVGLGASVLFLIASVVLAVMLVGAKSDLSDTKSDLSTAQSQVKAGKASQSAQAKTIADQKATILKLNPPAWTKAEAAQKYLQFVKPSNDLITKYNKIKDPTLKQARAYNKAQAVAINRMAQNMQNGQWPKSVQSLINNLIDSLAKDVSNSTEASKAETVDDLNSIVFEDGRAAQRVRIALGLPGAS